MSTISLANIEQLTQELEEEAIKLKKQIKECLLSLPDNPKIKRIGDSGKCFTINFSDIGMNNWTAFYHDFKRQYVQLTEVIDKLPLRSVPTRLKEIIRTKSYRQDNYTYHFHPDVIKHLADMLMLK